MDEQEEVVDEIFKDAELPVQKMEYRHRAQSIIQSKALDELETEVLTTGLYENVDLSLGSRVTVLVAETLYASIWWSVVSALLPRVWCYPFMGAVGLLELVMVLTWLSPLLLMVGAVQKMVSTPLGLFLLRLVVAAGSLSPRSPSALVRCALLSAGNACAMLALCAKWWHMSSLDLHRRVYCHMLGHLLYLALHTWEASFAPAYTSVGNNQFICALGLVVGVYLYSSDYRTPVVKVSTLDKQEHAEQGVGVVAARFGAVLFVTMLAFGDLVVMPRWAGLGTEPHLWGACALLALLTGLVVLSHREDLVQHISWALVGLLGSLSLLLLSSHTALMGGCIFATYVASQWPPLVKKLVTLPPWKALGISMATVIFLAFLAQMAHSYVPGSADTKGKCLVVVVAVFLAVLSFQNMLEVGETFKPHQVFLKLAWGRGKAPLHKKATLHPARPHALRHRLPTIEEDEEEEEEEEEEGEEEGEGSDINFTAHTVHEEREREMASLEKHEGRHFNSKVTSAALIIVAFAVWGLTYDYYHHLNPPKKEWPGIFSSAIWELDVSCCDDYAISMNAQFIQDARLEVVAVVTALPVVSYFGSHDYALQLSQRLDMFVEYGPHSNEKPSVLVFSKHPIVEVNPWPREASAVAAINASGVIATINVSGSIVDFYCLRFEDDVGVMGAQVEGVELLSRTERPSVVMAYVSTPLGCPAYNQLMASAGLKNINPSSSGISPSSSGMSCCIYYRDVIRVAHVSLDNMQVTRFRIPVYKDEPDAEVVRSDVTGLPEWYHMMSRLHPPGHHMKAAYFVQHSNVTP